MSSSDSNVLVPRYNCNTIPFIFINKPTDLNDKFGCETKSPYKQNAVNFSTINSCNKLDKCHKIDKTKYEKLHLNDPHNIISDKQLCHNLPEKTTTTILNLLPNKTTINEITDSQHKNGPIKVSAIEMNILHKPLHLTVVGLSESKTDSVIENNANKTRVDIETNSDNHSIFILSDSLLFIPNLQSQSHFVKQLNWSDILNQTTTANHLTSSILIPCHWSKLNFDYSTEELSLTGTEIFKTFPKTETCKPINIFAWFNIAQEIIIRYDLNSIEYQKSILRSNISDTSQLILDNLNVKTKEALQRNRNDNKNCGNVAKSDKHFEPENLKNISLYFYCTFCKIGFQLFDVHCSLNPTINNLEYEGINNLHDIPIQLSQHLKLHFDKINISCNNDNSLYEIYHTSENNTTNKCSPDKNNNIDALLYQKNFYCPPNNSLNHKSPGVKNFNINGSKSPKDDNSDFDPILHGICTDIRKELDTISNVSEQIFLFFVDGHQQNTDLGDNTLKPFSALLITTFAEKIVEFPETSFQKSNEISPLAKKGLSYRFNSDSPDNRPNFDELSQTNYCSTKEFHKSLDIKSDLSRPNNDTDISINKTINNNHDDVNSGMKKSVIKKLKEPINHNDNYHSLRNMEQSIDADTIKPDGFKNLSDTNPLKRVNNEFPNFDGSLTPTSANMAEFLKETSIKSNFMSTNLSHPHAEMMKYLTANYPYFQTLFQDPFAMSKMYSWFQSSFIGPDHSSFNHNQNSDSATQIFLPEIKRENSESTEEANELNSTTSDNERDSMSETIQNDSKSCLTNRIKNGNIDTNIKGRKVKVGKKSRTLTKRCWKQTPLSLPLSSSVENGQSEHSALDLTLSSSKLSNNIGMAVSPKSCVNSSNVEVTPNSKTCIDSINLASTNGSVECPKCDLVLGSSRSLGGHMTMMHSRNSCKTLKCPKCNWHYKYKETLEIHMKEKHPLNGSDAKAASTCTFCLNGEAHPRLARGENYVCGYKPYKCQICNYSTTTKGNLSIHMQSDKHANNVHELNLLNGGTDGKGATNPINLDKNNSLNIPTTNKIDKTPVTNNSESDPLYSSSSTSSLSCQTTLSPNDVDKSSPKSIANQTSHYEQTELMAKDKRNKDHSFSYPTKPMVSKLDSTYTQLLIKQNGQYPQNTIKAIESTQSYHSNYLLEKFVQKIIANISTTKLTEKLKLTLSAKCPSFICLLCFTQTDNFEKHFGALLGTVEPSEFALDCSMEGKCDLENIQLIQKLVEHIHENSARENYDKHILQSVISEPQIKSFKESNLQTFTNQTKKNLLSLEKQENLNVGNNFIPNVNSWTSLIPIAICGSCQNILTFADIFIVTKNPGILINSTANHDCTDRINPHESFSFETLHTSLKTLLETLTKNYSTLSTCVEMHSDSETVFADNSNGTLNSTEKNGTDKKSQRTENTYNDVNSHTGGQNKTKTTTNLKSNCFKQHIGSKKSFSETLEGDSTTSMLELALTTTTRKEMSKSLLVLMPNLQKKKKSNNETTNNVVVKRPLSAALSHNYQQSNINTNTINNLKLSNGEHSLIDDNKVDNELENGKNYLRDNKSLTFNKTKNENSRNMDNIGENLKKEMKTCAFENEHSDSSGPKNIGSPQINGYSNQVSTISSQTLSDNNSLLGPKRKNYRMRNYAKCKLCSMTFNKVSILKTHILRMHPTARENILATKNTPNAIMPETGSDLCDMTSFNPNAATNLLLNMGAQQSANNSNNNGNCQTNLPSNPRFSTLEKFWDPQRPFKCPLCLESFTQKNILLVHFNSVSHLHRLKRTLSSHNAKTTTQNINKPEEELQQNNVQEPPIMLMPNADFSGTITTKQNHITSRFDSALANIARELIQVDYGNDHNKMSTHLNQMRSPESQIVTQNAITKCLNSNPLKRKFDSSPNDMNDNCNNKVEPGELYSSMYAWIEAFEKDANINFNGLHDSRVLKSSIAPLGDTPSKNYTIRDERCVENVSQNVSTSTLDSSISVNDSITDNDNSNTKNMDQFGKSTPASNSAKTRKNGQTTESTLLSPNSEHNVHDVFQSLFKDPLQISNSQQDSQKEAIPTLHNAIPIHLQNDLMAATMLKQLAAGKNGLNGYQNDMTPNNNFKLGDINSSAFTQNLNYNGANPQFDMRQMLQHPLAPYYLMAASQYYPNTVSFQEQIHHLMAQVTNNYYGCMAPFQMPPNAEDSRLIESCSTFNTSQQSKSGLLISEKNMGGEDLSLGGRQEESSNDTEARFPSLIPTKNQGKHNNNKQQNNQCMNKVSLIESNNITHENNNNNNHLTFSNVGGVKRARTRINDDQLKVLRAHFDINNSPTEEQIRYMSDKSGLPQKVIKHWFRNTLFKERQRNKDSPYNFNNPPLTKLNPDSENDFQTDNDDMDLAGGGNQESTDFTENPNGTLNQIEYHSIANEESCVSTSASIKDFTNQTDKKSYNNSNNESKNAMFNGHWQPVTPNKDKNVQSTENGSHNPHNLQYDNHQDDYNYNLSNYFKNIQNNNNMNYNKNSPNSLLASDDVNIQQTNCTSPDELRNTLNASPADEISSTTQFPLAYSYHNNTLLNNAAQRRANRTRFNDAQIRVLQEYFDKNAYPKDDELDSISQILGLSPRVIVVWFQNARQKARKHYESYPAHLLTLAKSSSELSPNDKDNEQSSQIIQEFSATIHQPNHERKHQSPQSSSYSNNCDRASSRDNFTPTLVINEKDTNKDCNMENESKNVQFEENNLMEKRNNFDGQFDTYPHASVIKTPNGCHTLSHLADNDVINKYYETYYSRYFKGGQTNKQLGVSNEANKSTIASTSDRQYDHKNSLITKYSNDCRTTANPSEDSNNISPRFKKYDSKLNNDTTKASKNFTNSAINSLNDESQHVIQQSLSSSINSGSTASDSSPTVEKNSVNVPDPLSFVEQQRKKYWNDYLAVMKSYFQKQNPGTYFPFTPESIFANNFPMQSSNNDIEYSNKNLSAIERNIMLMHQLLLQSSLAQRNAGAVEELVKENLYYPFSAGNKLPTIVDHNNYTHNNNPLAFNENFVNAYALQNMCTPKLSPNFNAKNDGMNGNDLSPRSDTPKSESTQMCHPVDNKSNCMMDEERISTTTLFGMTPHRDTLDDVDNNNGIENGELTTASTTKKRLRTNISPEQLLYLHRHYQTESNPSKIVMEKIARDIGLKKRVVQVWFQNARARDKKSTVCFNYYNQVKNCFDFHQNASNYTSNNVNNENNATQSSFNNINLLNCKTENNNLSSHNTQSNSNLSSINSMSAKTKMGNKRGSSNCLGLGPPKSPKRCPFCNMFFRARSLLDLHVKIKHEESYEEFLKILPPSTSNPEEASNERKSHNSTKKKSTKPSLHVDHQTNNTDNFGEANDKSNQSTDTNYTFNYTGLFPLDLTKTHNNKGVSFPKSISNPLNIQKSPLYSTLARNDDNNNNNHLLKQLITQNLKNSNGMDSPCNSIPHSQYSDVSNEAFESNDHPTIHNQGPLNGYMKYKSNLHYNSIHINERDESLKRKTADMPGTTFSTPENKFVLSTLSAIAETHGGDISCLTANKRYRTQMNNSQVACMKYIFNDYKAPTMIECELLGSKIGLSKRVVQVWFQNARAKEKKHKNSHTTLFKENGEWKNADSCALCSISYDSDLPIQNHIFSDEHIQAIKLILCGDDPKRCDIDWQDLESPYASTICETSYNNNLLSLSNNHNSPTNLSNTTSVDDFKKFNEVAITQQFSKRKCQNL